MMCTCFGSVSLYNFPAVQAFSTVPSHHNRFKRHRTVPQTTVIPPASFRAHNPAATVSESAVESQSFRHQQSYRNLLSHHCCFDSHGRTAATVSYQNLLKTVLTAAIMSAIDITSFFFHCARVSLTGAQHQKSATNLIVMEFATGHHHLHELCTSVKVAAKIWPFNQRQDHNRFSATQLHQRPDRKTNGSGVTIASSVSASHPATRSTVIA